MSLKKRSLATIAVVTLTLGSISSSRTVLAVSDCQKVKGIERVVDNGNGTASGTFTQAGKLNGTTQNVFTSDFAPTPDPNAFSFTDNLTLTTNEGVLHTRNITIFDNVKGVYSAIATD